MPRDTIPDWKGMPEDVPIASLSWHDIYIYTCDELGRDPTESEVRELFETVTDRMSDSMGEPFSDTMDVIMSMEANSMLKEKKYDISAMNDTELKSKKYCHNCEEVHDTYWEIATCEKNPEGLSSEPQDHGNDTDGIIKCSDAWCNPTLQTIPSEQITKEFVHTHNADEKCAQCHHMLESQ